METTVKNLSDTRVRVTIVLDGEPLAKAHTQALKKLSKSVKVPGFRSGRVPASVAAKHVDQAQLQEQILDDAMSMAIAESFSENDIRAIDRPTVEVKKYVPGEQLEFTAEVEVLPKVKLGNYKKLSARPKVAKVEDKEVNEILERMQSGYADKKPVERAAKLDDEVSIDFVGKKDGVAFDGGTATDYTLQLGSNQFIPGFEEGVVGHKPGETFDLELEFPAEYHAADLAGQKVTFTVTLKEVRELELPKLDDEFAKKTGQFESIKQLRDDIVTELSAQKAREASDVHKDALIEELIEKSDVSAPEILVEDQKRSMEQDFQQNLMYRGMTMEAYVASQGYKDIEDWRAKELEPAAIKRVKAGLVLAEVTRAEDITADESQVDARIEAYRQQYASNQEMIKQLETAEARRDIANHFVTENTIDRLVELNS